MRAQRVALAVGVVALGAGLVWYLARSDQGSTERPGSAAQASSTVETHSAALGSQPSRTAPAPSAAPRTLKDRKHRDEVRERIYAAFGEAPPGTPKAPNPPSSVPSPPLAPPPTPGSKPKGSLAKEYIQKRIREDFLPLAKECYEAALERDPELGGKLTVNFEIVGDESVGGIVESAELSDDSDIRDEEFMYCMRESMLSMSFEPPKGGGSVTVTYPFLFSNEDDDSEAPSP